MDCLQNASLHLKPAHQIMPRFYTFIVELTLTSDAIILCHILKRINFLVKNLVILRFKYPIQTSSVRAPDTCDRSHRRGAAQSSPLVISKSD